MVRPGMLTRVVPACVDSGPSSAEVGWPMAAPDATFTSSTVGAVVTAAVVLARTGCTNRAKIVPLTGVTAEIGRTVVVVPEVEIDVEIGVSDAFSTEPLAR